MRSDLISSSQQNMVSEIISSEIRITRSDLYKSSYCSFSFNSDFNLRFAGCQVWYPKGVQCSLLLEINRIKVHRNSQKIPVSVPLVVSSHADLAFMLPGFEISVSEIVASSPMFMFMFILFGK